MKDNRVGKKYKFARQSVAANKQLDYLFELFRNAKTAEGRSPRTIQQYEEYYRHFCGYLEKTNIERSITAVTPDVLRSYMHWMLHECRRFDGHAHKSEEEQTIGLSPVTINTKMGRLKTMFSFLLQEGAIERDPSASIGRLKEPQRKLRILTIEEMQKLIAAPNVRTYAGFRDYVALHILIDTFARIGEVLSIKNTDVDFKLGMIYFDESTVKTRRGRTVPVSRRTLRLIKELMSENADFDNEYLILNNYGERLRNDRLRDRIKEHADNAGLDVRVTPHLFRHTGATLFLENGGDLRHLSGILGHVDMRSVMRYTHISDKALKAQHELYTPMNEVLKPLNKERKIARK
ncbi:tyrosine-type recombinase/integrase [Paenibacillus sp. ACRRY]|uniref:tyrosine-type recombinase/integrase n=1 Tax=Paenibacillus sp. ACRRY TaxID=2918208 RepID=UPI001EF40952|nr:tyrosine-type recombinase/integrase [Paenibacillus sp. ACRRY]MCG7386855.1 tyrosine-type recombinase/integrase [Paenibacillus sp. ACRRY]